MTRANRSLTFVGDALIGWNETSLIRSTGPDHAEVLVPQITAYGGMVAVPDGRIFLSETLGSESLLMVSPEGSVQLVAAGVGAYGVTLGPDGRVYAAGDRSQNALFRIDPSTLEVERLLDFPDGIQGRLIEFSPDGRTLYIGTRTFEDGTIHRVGLDDDFRPLGELEPFATTPDWYHDVLVVDACGNLYVTSFEGGGFHRISPGGAVTTLGVLTPEQHIHGAAWGSGQGFWDANTLYFAHPNQGSIVTAYAVGLPAR
jgi:DNA-binding beta-propeller fold protein YncE